MKGYFHKRGGKWSFTIDAGFDSITGKNKQMNRGEFRKKKEEFIALRKIYRPYEN